MSSVRDPAERPFGTVAILGLGVMGGSLARALAALPDAPRVVGWSPHADERAAAVEAGAVADAPDTWADAVGGADLVVLAAPLRASCEALGRLAEATSDAVTVSDVASLKAPLARAAAAAGLAGRWVGAHPMAGSERSGFAASRPDLYCGARVWISYHREAEERVQAVHALWRAVGASPLPIGWEEHDRLMANASHLPQLAANALASVMAEAGITPEHLGPGGRDMTRLAASNPLIWKDLLAEASPELIGALRALAKAAERLAGHLEKGELDAIREMMASTGEWRRS